MSANPGPPKDAAGVLRIVQTLHQLTLEATLAESAAGLIFHILNRTILMVSYHRAALFSLSGGRPVLLGISGQSDINSQSPLVKEWEDLVRALPDPATTVGFPGDYEEALEERWQVLRARTQGLSVLWVPIKLRGDLLGGIILERWSGSHWLGEEVALLERLMEGYAGAMEKFKLHKSWRTTLKLWKSRKRFWWAMAAALFVMFFYPVRLRVVAPCKVVPSEQAFVTAPLNGIIEDVAVERGEIVRAGQLLFTYDGDLFRKELDVALSEVEVLKSRLERTQVEAFDKEDERADLQILRHRLAQGNIRLAHARAQAAKLVVNSPCDGAVDISRPREIIGRSVNIGEPILSVADPSKNMIRIWIPESDNLDFDPGVPAQIYLDINPTESLPAKLGYVSNHVGRSPEQVAAFEAEAVWLEKTPTARLGLGGRAVLHGPEVSVLYWLFRRPILAARRWFGI